MRKKRLIRIAIGIVMGVVVLCALPLLIYVPPVQQWLVQRVAAIASDETGLDISVERVNLSFPLDLAVDGVVVSRPAPDSAGMTDTIAVVQRAVVDVRLLPLLHGEVYVQGLSLEETRLNTLDLISDVQVKGMAGRLSLDPSRVHLSEGRVDLSTASMDRADIAVLLSDTAAVDTTASGPTPWRINFDKLTISSSHVAVHLSGDSMLIDVGAARMTATDGRINLLDSHYAVGTLAWTGGTLVYDLPFEPSVRTLQHPSLFDYSHISLSHVNLRLDSVVYDDATSTFRLQVAEAALRDTCGFALSQLHGNVAVDTVGVSIAGLSLITPYSNIYGRADIDYSVADSLQPGRMDIDLNAKVGKQDMAFFYDDLDLRTLPEWPLTLQGQMKGNVHHADFNIQQLAWPTVLDASGSGYVKNVLDTDRMQAVMNIKAKSYNIKPLLTMLDLQDAGFTIPAGLSIEGDATVDGFRYTADLTARDGRGVATLKGRLDQRLMAYDAKVTARALNVQRFMPTLPLTISNSQLSLKGRGTDFMKPGAWLDAEGTISHMAYDGHDMNDLRVQAHLKNGHAMADIISCNTLLDGTASVDMLLDAKEVKGSLSTAISHLDLYALGLAEHPLTVGLEGDFDLTTNLEDSHRLSGLIDHIYLRDSVQTYHPEKVGILLNARPDTTYLRAQSGTLIVKLDASGNYNALAERLTTLADTIGSQLSHRTINQPLLKSMLPTARLYVSSGRSNPMADMLKASANIDFRGLLVDLNTSPQSGLNGSAHLYGLNADSTRIDTIKVTLIDKPHHGLTFQGRIANNKRNPQFVFTALVDGLLQEHGASMGLRFFDAQGMMGLRIGAKAEMEEGGMRFHLLPSRPTIGYREFAVNDDNYLFLRDNLRLQAKVNLLADDGTGIRVYTPETAASADDMLQDLTISLNRFDLDRLTAALPYVPRITGMLNGDYHLTMDQKRQISVATDMQVLNMTYEGCPMGNLSTEFVYLQREDETHAVDGMLMQNGHEVAMFQGNYRNRKVTGGNEHLDGTLTLLRAPLGLINGFIPDQLIGLEGYAEGELSMEGSLTTLDVNGEVLLDSAYLVSQPYGIRLRFDNDPVRIQQSKLLLENFTMYAYNDNPLNIMGNIDFHDLDHMTLDMKMRASNFMLINSKRTAKSIAYGKGFVNFLAVMRGPLDQLKMRGKLDVLGTTDLTYLLLDSPLSTDNQLDELVRFTDFTDTTQTVVQRPAPDGFDMDLTISIDEGAHVLCGLNDALSNYIDFFGGGDLKMRYNNTEDLRLNGRYTLTSGEMKYSLPVIPLKTFRIQDGSYVEFSGDPMNPTLNITATEQTKAAVGQDGGQSKTVLFDCGVVITRTLNDMGLQFIISAPEDLAVAGELAAMSVEQRGKLAVTMLTTGMYLADGNTSGFSMNSALSSFLESEINNITGNALKTIDLSIGLDNTTDATGQMHTDYSFKFAKRFWNNRLKVQIGGSISTGSEMQGQNRSFFDNVTMEYRLSPTSNQYVKLFYNQNAYDWLEGYTSEYGAGYLWKRKLDSLWDFFPKKERNDTIR